MVHPKGLRQVLEERWINTRRMNLEDTRKELSAHTDFRDEKLFLEHFLTRRGHACMYGTRHTKGNDNFVCRFVFRELSCLSVKFHFSRYRLTGNQYWFSRKS